VILQTTLGVLAVVSFGLTLWQWLVARRFPLHQRSASFRSGASLEPRNASQPGREPALPAVTLLKPLKDADGHTEACLRSWFNQDYPGEIQILFGVETASDAACAIVNKLLAEFPQRDAKLILCPEQIGANAKVAKLAQLEPLAKHELIVVSDADVRVPSDLLTNVLLPLTPSLTWERWRPAGELPGENEEPAGGTPALPGSSGTPVAGNVGLTCCFYQLANPTTRAMRWEAISINADFWSQVLQSQSLKPLDFALGAVMAVRRKQLAEIGGFRALADCAADDYQLGQRIAKRGHPIELCPVVVECWSAPMSWRSVWRHQLRWARTIRVCEPLPYFLSILSNATLWPLLWLLSAWPWIAHVSSHTSDNVMVTQAAVSYSTILAAAFLLCRVLVALGLQSRLTQSPRRFQDFWLVPVKDLLQALIWAAAFLGNRIEWRGDRFRLRRDGTMEKH
jgi:ceramide glucosyltransferase